MLQVGALAMQWYNWQPVSSCYSWVLHTCLSESSECCDVNTSQGLDIGFEDLLEREAVLLPSGNSLPDQIRRANNIVQDISFVKACC